MKMAIIGYLCKYFIIFNLKSIFIALQFIKGGSGQTTEEHQIFT